MNILTAQTLALESMDEHGLLKQGWSFSFDNAKRRHGCTHHDTKKITLSRELTELNDLEEVNNTILHEIAHALVGSRHGHDRVWAYKCTELGILPRRCASSSAVHVEHKWTGTCPNGHTTKRLRRMKLACRICCTKFNHGRFTTEYAFVWTENAKAGLPA